jgi:DNA primase
MYRIPQEKIEEIRSAVNIVHYIAQFINLKKEGRNFKGLCPFHHEKTPSFIVSPEKQFYHCFGCGQGGNLFKFIMDYEKLTFVEAVTKSADFAGIPVPKADPKSEQEINYTQQLYDVNEAACAFFEKELFKEKNKTYLNYFAERKLSAKTIKKFRLSYAPDSFDALLKHLQEKNIDLKLAETLGLLQKKQNSEELYVKFRQRIMFPFFNVAGKIIGFGGRRLNEEQQPKYLNSPESTVYKKGQTLYGLHQAIQAIREADFIILVEGYFDLLRLVDSGIKNVVASSGTALTEQQARLMGRFSKNIYVAYDGDTAGIKAAVRNARIIENEDLNAFIVPMPAGEDPDTYVLKYGLKKFHELLDKKLLLIEFQIDNYLLENPEPSLEQKDHFINEVLNELTRFKSPVKTGLYLHHLSERMQVGEAMLINEINRLKKRKVYFKQTAVDPADGDTPPVEVKVMRGVHRAEEGVIELLLNAGDEIRNYITHHVTTDLFENEDYAGLYGFIIHELEEFGKVDIHALFENAELNAEQHRILTRLTINMDTKDMKFAIDCIFQLKKWLLEKKSRDIQRHIQAEAHSAESGMHYTSTLNDLRKQIARIEKEHSLEIKAIRPVAE